MQKNNQTGRGLYHCARPPACSFCPGGMPDPDIAIPSANLTCEGLAKFSLDIEGPSPTCQQLKMAERLCCGGGPMTAANNTNKVVCSFCPKGISNADFIVPGSGGTTCEELAVYANQSELVASECQNIQLAEPLCCVPWKCQHKWPVVQSVSMLSCTWSCRNKWRM